MFFPDIFLPMVTAFVLTALTTPLCIYAMKKLGVIDDPGRINHPGIIHTKPIPRGGGIPLFLGAIITSLIFLPLTTITIAIYVAATIVLIVGVIDDKLNAESKDIPPYLRFLVTILCAVIVVGSGVTISFTTNPLTGGILLFDTFTIPFLFGMTIQFSQIISILWIIWVTNMLNWSKGVDGQMPGIVIISSIVIGLLSLRFVSADPYARTDVMLAFIIAGSMLGFLLYNFHPAKIFPGYGATAMYLLVAIVSILSSSKLATALLVMGVPTVDALFTIGRRIIAHKSPFHGDKKHLHHMLLSLGYTQRQIALFYWCISGALGIISLTLESKSKLFALIMVGVIVGMILLFLHYITRELHEENSS